jgi:TPR repeat protein
MSAHRTPFSSILIAGLVSLCASACATGDLLDRRVDVAGVDYDSQTCVENALRNGPDPRDVRDAATAFAGACGAGEAASCSVLGVMYELGTGFPANGARALELYEAACGAHNVRACANRDRFLLTARAAARDPGARVSDLHATSERGNGG